MKRLSRLGAVLAGGTIAGALDILFALTHAAVNGMEPQRLLQVVASGLLGQDAYARARRALRPLLPVGVAFRRRRHARAPARLEARR